MDVAGASSHRTSKSNPTDSYSILPLAHRSKSMSCRTLWSEHGSFPKRDMQSPLMYRDQPRLKAAIRTYTKQLCKHREAFGRHIRCCTFDASLRQDAATCSWLCRVEATWKWLGLVRLVKKKQGLSQDLVQITKREVRNVTWHTMTFSVECNCNFAKGNGLFSRTLPLQATQKVYNNFPTVIAVPP